MGNWFIWQDYQEKWLLIFVGFKAAYFRFFSEIFWIENANFIDLYEEPINGEIIYRAVLDISQYPQISVTEGTVVGFPDWQKTAKKLILKQNHFLLNTLAHFSL